MAITPKNEEKLAAFEAEFRAEGDRLSPAAVAELGTKISSRKLEDALRAAIYVESMHQREQNKNWDKLLPVDDLMETLRNQL